MTPASHKLIAGFEMAAQEAKAAEARLRKAMAEEMARIEWERVLAFRRTRLIRLLASSLTGAEDEPAALAVQARALCDELSFNREIAAHAEVIEQLKSVGRAVWRCVCAAEDEWEPAHTREALSEFENWFQKARGQSFYTLFDHHIPETPLIDF